MRKRNFNPRFRNFPIHEVTMDRKVTPKHTDKFYKKKRGIKRVILSKTEKHEVIHGETAVHKQTPRYLHRHTGDIDILSPTPREDAYETERALDKHFGGDFFYVDQGRHPGTWRVIAHANKESVADYTKREGKIPSKQIGKHNYVPLSHIKRRAKRVLNDPFSSYRHGKDQDTFNRIKIVQKKKGGK